MSGAQKRGRDRFGKPADVPLQSTRDVSLESEIPFNFRVATTQPLNSQSYRFSVVPLILHDWDDCDHHITLCLFIIVECDPLIPPLLATILSSSSNHSSDLDTHLPGGIVVIGCSTSIDNPREAHSFTCGSDGSWSPDISYLPSQCSLVSRCASYIIRGILICKKEPSPHLPQVFYKSSDEQVSIILHINPVLSPGYRIEIRKNRLLKQTSFRLVSLLWFLPMKLIVNN